MSTEPPPAASEILATVAGWPAEQRRYLVKDVLHTLAPEPDAARRRAALERLRGIPATDNPPSDDDIRRRLDERRMQTDG